jgi:hypothetical protein
MRLLFLSVLTAAILIGGETLVMPQVAVRVVVPPVVVPQVVMPQIVVPQVVVPQVGFPEVVVPQVIVPYPVFGGFNERRRDVYAYGHRGHESRERAHHDDRGNRGERR